MFEKAIMEQNLDGTYYVEQEILLHDSKTGEDVKAFIRIPRAMKDKDGILFALVVPDK